MSQIKDDKFITDLGKIIANSDINTSDKKIAKAQYDKSYNATILGINRYFTDDVTKEEQKELIDKHSIPEVPDKDNYYTFKINGNYYVKSSNTSFNLYENVKIRIPNGNWDNMYIEVQKDTVKESGSAKWITSVLEPTDSEYSISDGDYWVRIDDEALRNIIEVKRYSNGKWDDLEYYAGIGRALTNRSNLIFNDQHGNKLLANQDTSEYNSIFGKRNYIVPSANCRFFLGNVSSDFSNRNYIISFDYSSAFLDIDSDLWVNKDSYILTIISPNNSASPWYGLYDSGFSLIRNYVRYELQSDVAEYLQGWSYSYSVSLSLEQVRSGQITISFDEFEDVNLSFSDECLLCICPTSECYVDNTIISGNNNIIMLNSKDNYYNGTQCIFGEFNSSIDGKNCVITGKRNLSIGDNSFVGGIDNVTECESSLVAGTLNFVRGSNNVVSGHQVRTYGQNSVAVGLGLDAKPSQSAIFGTYNADKGAGIILGNGTSDSALGRSNAMEMISATGNLWVSGSVSDSGGDYSEYYEWEDENTSNEDRTGLFVAINERKIRLADNNDNYILGVISSTPSIIGNDPHSWKNRWKKDIFERVLRDENGHPIISEEFNPELEYIPRGQRPEYSPVGTHGQLIVIDDGTCEVNGYCGVGKNGIGTKCEDMEKVYRGLAFRVTERIDETHVRIIIK